MAAQLSHPDSLRREEAIDQLLKVQKERALPLLQEALKHEEDEDLRLKLLTALSSFGDKRGIEGMIDVLSAGLIPFVRMEALEHLQEVSGDSFGYDPFSDPEKNREAIERWREWWEANGETIYWDEASRSFKVP